MRNIDTSKVITDSPPVSWSWYKRTVLCPATSVSLNMFSFLLLTVVATSLAHDGRWSLCWLWYSMIIFPGPHSLEWTITGEPFTACVRPGNTLTFKWEGPWHNVEQVNAEGYENCSGFSNTEGVEGPYVFKAKREGEFYFVCGVGFISSEVQAGQYWFYY